MRVYFVRHGESEYNAKQLFQHGDVPLSEKGRKQAEFLSIILLLANSFIIYYFSK